MAEERVQRRLVAKAANTLPRAADRRLKRQRFREVPQKGLLKWRGEGAELSLTAHLR